MTMSAVAWAARWAVLGRTLNGTTVPAAHGGNTAALGPRHRHHTWRRPVRHKQQDVSHGDDDTVAIGSHAGVTGNWSSFVREGRTGIVIALESSCTGP